MALENNYFVCTLGQAAALDTANTHPYKTIPEFLQQQAHESPSLPAVGFPLPPRVVGENWNHVIYTFQDLQAITIMLVQDVCQYNLSLSESHDTVALLASSSPNFLFHWLALVSLGYSVLLIAPQCQPSAIRHLCKECKVTTLFYDDEHASLAKRSCKECEPFMPCHAMENYYYDSGIAKYAHRSQVLDANTLALWPILESNVAYLHHTSGTSSGLPKPIPQTHRAAVGVLPNLSDGRDRATFTTTPLYHGGVADCFRAWTSGAMIWLFPGADVPVTATNVLRSLRCARTATLEQHTPAVAYFSSVPYVLQMMAEDCDGLKFLTEMEIVGVGGAALPEDTGDNLVSKGVNLISRFGSAECGFLMSSHRVYTYDKEWQYLRTNGSSLIAFEARDDGLSELVIRQSWPHMAKRNRADGSYASADLFEPHKAIPHAWKYHSRADAQLTLNSGKKFDPAPLEAAIATSPLLSDVLIFGNGYQYPGALLFRSSNSIDMSRDNILGELWPLVQKLNEEGQVHTRISKAMLIIMPTDTPGLEKSSKGTIMRGAAERKYNSEIKSAYGEDLSAAANGISVGADHNTVADEDILATVQQIIQDGISTQNAIPENIDLFAFGVDSVACMQIKAQLQSKCLPPKSASLPFNVVYDCGTIRQLSNYVLSMRKGHSVEGQDEIQLMRDLVNKYSDLEDMTENLGIHTEGRSPKHRTQGGVVLLTGATGALGAHILALLHDSPQIREIHCLVRAKTKRAAQERVHESLRMRGIEASFFYKNINKTIFCHPCRLSLPFLGLSIDIYAYVLENVSIIIHAAWAVNFNMRLPSFVKDHINGLRNLLNLAFTARDPTPPRFIFCSSTASVLSTHAIDPVPEAISKDPLAASPLGYSRSKWVAEAICEVANNATGLKNSITVLRLGQLCGDTRNGVWNKSEAWPLMLNSMKATGSLPDLDEGLDWLPVDIAAKAVLEIALTEVFDSPEAGRLVYHILNPSKQTTWTDLLCWMQKLAPGFETLAPADWVSRLENMEGRAASHPAQKLLGLWREAYCQGNRAAEKKEEITFEMKQTMKASPSIKHVTGIDEELYRKLWSWIDKANFESY